MEDSMQAATIVNVRELTLREVPKPEPLAGQVRVALEGTGVCASNLPLWQGAPWMQYPLAPGQGGHEAWGVVDKVGQGVDGHILGKRVAILSNNAYAEYDVASAEQLVVLPEALAGKPFPGEAIGCAVNIFIRSRIAKGQTVAIVGVGFLGALLTRLAERAGARVIGLSRRSHPLEVARSMGARDTVVMDDHHAIIERVRQLTEGRLCDCVIEATGKAWPLDLAAELTREGGRMVIAGYHQDGPRTINMQLWNWRGFDVINAHERDPKVSLRGMREAVRLVSEGILDPTPLYTHFKLKELGQAFEATGERPGSFMKALVHVEARS
jgi:threonine dehydrogenase-like Zn-dependent dehydrogenase